MKTASATCVALLGVSLIAISVDSYYNGRAHLYLEPPESTLLANLWEAKVLFFLVPLGLWVVSLIRKKNRLWTTWALFGYIAFAALGTYTFLAALGLGNLTLPLWLTPGFAGLRDRVLQKNSLDDLRQFAHDFQQECPGMEVSNSHIYPVGVYDVGKEASAEAMAARLAKFQILRKKYDFLNLGPMEVRDDGTDVSLSWNGPTKEWGVCILTNGTQNDPYANHEEFAASDDIRFFYFDPD